MEQDDNTGADQPPQVAHRPPVAETVAPVGGRIKVEPEDFVVEELPAYQPCGEGQHFFVRVQKRDVDARTLVDRLAGRFGLSRGDVGTAGHKDRRAITRQWVSLPAHKVDEPPQCGVVDDGIEILEVSRHTNKLRTGHLEGNRFELRIRDTEVVGDRLRDRIEKTAQVLERRGLANYFGLQRFGNDASTLHAGWRWLTSGDKPRGRFMRTMAASAVQSEIFNRFLARRLTDESWKTVVDGDIFEKTDTGGRFWIDASEREETQRRLDDREIVVTGPMPGSKRGFADGETGRMEREIVAEMGLDEEDFSAFGRRGRGTRRPMTVYMDGMEWELEGDDTVWLQFELPAGSYATVVLREFMGEQPQQ